MQYQNPIIPGYNPDPSICRVGEDFYIVNSTFEFFPGVPIYHSRNLANWELIGHCLTRRSQLELEGCRNSGGIYAPTLRYHEGMFYMITTNVTWKGNFVVHAEDIRGPWSEPCWIDQGGIDPSLMWDDDGSCYYCSTGTIDGVRGIVVFAIDPMTGQILSDKKIVSTGCGGQCTEGPHIYKINGFYYLMTAEGGTEYGHHENILRAENIWGPYIPCPHNPILSHIHRKGYEIQATGHADLVEDQNGNWWAVCLAHRNFSHALLHNLGRETFLAPVSWTDDGWPIIGHHGYIDLVMDGPLPSSPEPVCHDLSLNFHNDVLDPRMLYTRNPNPDHFRINPEEGTLTLHGTEISISQPGASPTIISTQQPAFCTHVEAVLDPSASNARRTGISAYYNNDYHYDIYISCDGHGQYVGFTKSVHDMTVEIIRQRIGTSPVTLRIDSDREKYTFSYQEKGHDPIVLGSGHNAGLSTEGTKTMTFTGTMFALFAEEGDGVFRSFQIQVPPENQETPHAK